MASASCEFVAVVAGLLLSALFVALMASCQRFECAECVTSADWLTCERFDDGRMRCVEEATTCLEGHVTLPGWAHALLLALVAAAVGAWRWMRRGVG